MRVLVTGMGGELGTRVAQLLEDLAEVREIVGVDFVPPRRRLRRSEFRRIDPRDEEALEEFVVEVAPDAVAHMGVYEPASRTGPRSALERTRASTLATLPAAAGTGRLRRIVVRSGLEVYGARTHRSPAVPDEGVAPAPTSPYGAALLHVETVAAGVGRRAGIPVSALRYAPTVGAHVPSPLGRLLRLPVVPVPAIGDPPFSLLHAHDAAEAMVRALLVDHDGPLNVVGPGAATPRQAARLGGRLPVPVWGPGWELARRSVELAGAAVAPHVIELLRHGRTGTGSRAVDVLGLGGLRDTQEVLADLYEWAAVVPLAEGREAVA